MKTGPNFSDMTLQEQRNLTADQLPFDVLYTWNQWRNSNDRKELRAHFDACKVVGIDPAAVAHIMGLGTKNPAPVKKKIKLTQKMSFTEVCKILGVADNDIALLWDIVKHSNSANLNQSGRVTNIMGQENYLIFHKWLF